MPSPAPERGVPAPRLHAVVIGWTGKAASCRQIADALVDHVDQLTVVYSNRDDEVWTGPGDWIKVPDDWFYGPKFVASLQRHADGVMLQIQGDVTCEDWPEVARACRAAFREHPGLGVWAPNVAGTTWTQATVAVAPVPDSQLVAVVQTDGICWALSEAVTRYMKTIAGPLAENHGWGVEWPAITHCYSQGLLVARDVSLMVTHPMTTGYDQGLAAASMAAMLAKLPLHQQVMHQVLHQFGHSPKPH